MQSSLLAKRAQRINTKYRRMCREYLVISKCSQISPFSNTGPQKYGSPSSKTYSEHI